MRSILKIGLWFVCLGIIVPVWAAGGEGDHGSGSMRLIAKIFNFLVFFGGLWYLLRKPVVGFFTKRLQDIRDALEMAEKSREEAKVRLDEIEQKMANLDEELAEIESQAKAEAEREKERIEAEAQKEAERILAQARAEIDNMRRSAILELKSYVSELALDEAERIIRDTISAEERQRLFKDFSERLGAKS